MAVVTKTKCKALCFCQDNIFKIRCCLYTIYNFVYDLIGPLHQQNFENCLNIPPLCYLRTGSKCYQRETGSKYFSFSGKLVQNVRREC